MVFRTSPRVSFVVKQGGETFWQLRHSSCNGMIVLDNPAHHEWLHSQACYCGQLTYEKPNRNKHEESEKECSDDTPGAGWRPSRASASRSRLWRMASIGYLVFRILRVVIGLLMTPSGILPRHKPALRKALPPDESETAHQSSTTHSSYPDFCIIRMLSHTDIMLVLPRNARLSSQSLLAWMWQCDDPELGINWPHGTAEGAQLSEWWCGVPLSPAADSAKSQQKPPLGNIEMCGYQDGYHNEKQFVSLMVEGWTRTWNVRVVTNLHESPTGTQRYPIRNWSDKNSRQKMLLYQ